jgi:hypothetical protein
VNVGHGIRMHMHWFGIGMDVNVDFALRIHTKETIKQHFVLFEDG